ncbi:MAG: hypothetical protein M1389_09350 [Chloroflexi bacterium]|nr:hypothetical protein [Chloroflexota bacterium]
MGRKSADNKKAEELKEGLFIYVGKRDERAEQALEKARIQTNAVNLSRPSAPKVPDR